MNELSKKERIDSLIKFGELINNSMINNNQKLYNEFSYVIKELMAELGDRK